MPLLIGVAIFKAGHKQASSAVNSNAKVIWRAVLDVQPPSSAVHYPRLCVSVYKTSDFFGLRNRPLRFVAIPISMIGVAGILNAWNNWMINNLWHSSVTVLL